MNRIAVSRAKRFIDLEIEWCRAHPEKAPSDEFYTGFIQGLKQARHLLDGLAQMPAAGSIEVWTWIAQNARMENPHVEQNRLGQELAPC